MVANGHWYKNAIIYCLDVETYADSNGDGIGDFQGLTSRLDYLAGLGVTCLWLLPFYPSPNRDDGYDVADYCSVDPRYGSMADFVEFVVQARERGMHIILDLVANHTSNEHPWFQAARSDRNSPYNQYYVWRDDDPGDTSDQVVFPGEQDGIWTFDEEAGRYYLHHFYDFQPDLNFANPDVREEFRRIMGLWLKLGVDGFRIDAAPFLIDMTGIHDGRDMRPAHEFLRELRDFAMLRNGDSVLLGEVDVGLSTLADYFGGGNELQAVYNFPMNRFLFLSLSQESADPLKFALHELPTIPGQGQWVNFLRHHDELNIGRLTLDQRDKVLAAFGSAPEMQAYGRGLRRRLAPMLGGNEAKLRLAYSVLFSLPGTPMILYGEEIGMGENLSLPGRLSVRTPMQWTAYNSGGFSTGSPKSLVRPMVADGDFGFEQVNVGAQRRHPNSLMNWVASLMRVRKECREIGVGKWQMLETQNESVLALRYDANNTSIVVLNNLSSLRRQATLELDGHEYAAATDIFSDRHYEPISAKKNYVRLDGFGYRWLRLHGMY